MTARLLQATIVAAGVAVGLRLAAPVVVDGLGEWLYGERGRQVVW